MQNTRYWSLVLSFIFINILLVTSCKVKQNIVEPEDENGVVYDIKIAPKYVELDNLNRLYVVNENNVVINYSSENKEMYRYANNRRGNITDINVSNPLKILVFYGDFNQIVTLDNTLSPIKEFGLSDLGFSDISAVAITNDDLYWIYDPMRFRLLKINESGNVINESSNVQDFGVDSVNIVKIRESGNFVVLLDPDKGFYIFDNLGQFIRAFPASDVRTFQFDGRNIFYYTSTGLKTFNLTFFERMNVSTPPVFDFETLKYIVYSLDEYLEVHKKGINKKSKKK